MLICHLYIFFGDVSVKVFGQFLNQVAFLLLSCLRGNGSKQHETAQGEIPAKKLMDRVSEVMHVLASLYLNKERDFGDL